MREYEDALKRLLGQVNGTAVIVSSLKLARSVCGFDGRGRPESTEVCRAGHAIHRQYRNLPPGFQAAELEGGTFTVKFWREHHDN
jgi:hypothetical protein